MRRRVLAGTLVAAAFLGFAPLAAAQTPETVRNATVLLTARGDSSDPTTLGAPVKSHASGVVISPDGFVLTVHHLLGALGEVIPESVEIRARVGTNGTEQRAWVIDANPALDLLLLRLRRPDPYAPLPLGSAFDLAASATVRTYGFPAQGEFDTFGTGRITSRSFDGGFLWATDLDFVEGQSGSPVYDESGNLVALVKGSFRSRGMIIPIELADPLLAFLRFGEMRQELAMLRARLAAIEKTAASLEPLRRELRWSAQRADDKLTIAYEKRVGGGAHVARITVEARPFGRAAGGARVPLLPNPVSVELEPVRVSDDGAEFLWSASELDLFDRIAEMQGLEGPDVILDIRPVLADPEGTALDPVSVEVEGER